MIDQQPDAQMSVQQVRTIPIQERSVRVGDVIVVNGYRSATLYQRVIELAVGDRFLS
jgi:hypothetical protein